MEFHSPVFKRLGAAARVVPYNPYHKNAVARHPSDYFLTPWLRWRARRGGGIIICLENLNNAESLLMRMHTCFLEWK